MRYRYSAFRLLLAVTIILLAAIPPALATGEIPANIGTDAGPASAPTQEVNQADAAAAAGDVAPAPTGNIRWDTPRDLDHSLPEAGYGLSLARDNKTGLLHISYLEFSNKTDTPGMLVYQNGTGTAWNEPVIVDDTIGFWHRDVPESVRRTSIALGSDGLPHIAYMSWNDGYHLKYARMLRPEEQA
jgi:hypothetical protein